MNRTLYALALSVCSLSAVAQECSGGRYTTDAYFTDVVVTQAVPFGSNLAVAGGTQTLYMDVYEPQGDVLAMRPVVLVAFGGSFVAGARADVAELCRIFAKRGFVAIAPDYRIGFFLPNITTTTLAVMRGAHDMKACVRFLRKSVGEDGNPYGIDPDRIIVGGVSAGAISAIHAAYLNTEDELPAAVVSQSAQLGGVEGNSGSPGYSSEVLACYSFSGAIGDTTWIVPYDKPLCSVHEAGDEVVPYDTQEVSVFGIATGLIASGSHDLHLRFGHLNVPNCFLSYPTADHVGYLASDPITSVSTVTDFCARAVCGLDPDCGMQFVSVAETAEPLVAGIHPNPTAGPLRITMREAARVRLFDASGREVLNERLPIGTSMLDLAHLPDGVYLLRPEGLAPQVLRVVKVGG